jgi:hypothetical protein
MRDVGHAVLTGHSARTGVETGRLVSAAALLAGATYGPDIDVYLSPELVADLDQPDLVITPGYVGPERRRSARTATAQQPVSSVRARGLWALLSLLVGTMVVATTIAAIAFSLTLVTASGAAPMHALAATTGVGASTPRTALRTARVDRSRAARLARLARTGRHHSALANPAVAAASGRRAARAVRLESAQTAVMERRAARSARSVSRQASRDQLGPAKGAKAGAGAGHRTKA